jgi:hypothetical protein
MKDSPIICFAQSFYWATSQTIDMATGDFTADKNVWVGAIVSRNTAVLRVVYWV